MDNCIFCGNTIKRSVDKDLISNISCENCGKYKIAHQALKLIPAELKNDYYDRKHIMSGYIREMNDNELRLDTINVNNFTNLVNNEAVPKTIIEKADKLLLHILRKSRYMFDEVKVSSNQPAIAYSKSETDFASNFEALKQLGYINYSKVTIFTDDDNDEIAMRCSLTIEGLKRAQQLQKSVGGLKQCYVSMWYQESGMQIYDNYICNAITECGYSPVIIADKQTDHDTYDEIIMEIRKSKFVIVDLTGNKPGAYYEGGLALGLGKDIIYICKEDSLNDNVLNINHNNILSWKDGDDLYIKLKRRILATIVHEIE